MEDTLCALCSGTGREPLDQVWDAPCSECCGTGLVLVQRHPYNHYWFRAFDQKLVGLQVRKVRDEKGYRSIDGWIFQCWIACSDPEQLHARQVPCRLCKGRGVCNVV